MDHKAASMHATVILNGGAPVDLIHNFQFDLALPAEALQVPVIVMNAIAGGADGGCPFIAQKDGNTLSVGLLGIGPVTVDIWVFRHAGKGGSFWS
jgi:hypothetical protein